MTLITVMIWTFGVVCGYSVRGLVDRKKYLDGKG